MPVPNSIDDLEPVPADNYPAGSEPVFPNLDNYLRAHAAFIAQLRELLGTAGSDIESIEEEIGSVNAALALRVAKTSDTGIALLPEGSDAQRPAMGSIPAGALVMRGNTQDPADYKPEFWDRVAAGWKVFADRIWVTAAITALKNWVNEQIGYAVIYPNGGNEATPANVSPNVIYTMANPFPGQSVLCVAEIFREGRWGIAGFGSYYTSGVNASFGVEAFYSPATDSVKVKTGGTSLMQTARLDLQLTDFTTLGTNAESCPCRVKVWKIKGGAA